MRIQSFQTRIVVLSLLLSGFILGVLGVLGWSIFYRMGLNRIDNEIRSWGQLQLSKSRDLREWDRFARDMSLVFGRNQGGGSVILLVWNRAGTAIYRSSNWPVGFERPTVPPPSIATSRSIQAPFNVTHFVVPADFHTTRIGPDPWRFATMANDLVTLQMGVSLREFAAEMGRVRTAYLVALPLTLLLNAFAGWVIARRVVRPVRRIAETGRRITTERLAQRIPLRNEDHEFQELVAVLNQMLDRLQSGFQQAVRFSADAAHELKTPLTILQGQLEQALREASDGTSNAAIFESLMQEVQRLKSIVQKLLLLSKADAGQLELRLEQVNFTELVHEVADDISVLAPHLALHVAVEPAVFVRGDSDLLRQVLQNLASNAIKFNRPAGFIRLVLGQADQFVNLSIMNTGEPIPETDRGQIFDRFYRVDKSRGRRIDGTGLGLSLAREIVAAHNGTLCLAHTDSDATEFRMTLPTVFHRAP